MSTRRKSRIRAATMVKGPFRPELIMSPLHIARKNLEVVSSRLRRSAELATRLKLEGAELSVDDYLKRLKRRKAELTKQIQELSKAERAKWEQSKSGKPRAYRSPRFSSQPFRAVELDPRFIAEIRQFQWPCLPIDDDQSPFLRERW